MTLYFHFPVFVQPWHPKLPTLADPTLPMKAPKNLKNPWDRCCCSVLVYNFSSPLVPCFPPTLVSSHFSTAHYSFTNFPASSFVCRFTPPLLLCTPVPYTLVCETLSTRIKPRLLSHCPSAPPEILSITLTLQVANTNTNSHVILHNLVYLSGFLFILSSPLDKYLTFTHSPLCPVILAATKFNHWLHSYHLTPPTYFNCCMTYLWLPKYLPSNLYLPQDTEFCKSEAWSCLSLILRTWSSTQGVSEPLHWWTPPSGWQLVFSHLYSAMLNQVPHWLQQC